MYIQYSWWWRRSLDNKEHLHERNWSSKHRAEDRDFDVSLEKSDVMVPISASNSQTRRKAREGERKEEE